MNSNNNNPSNVFVKECFVSALIQLINVKPISSVSITELCNRAGVSRMSFYRNYNTVEEIFSDHLKEIFVSYKNDDDDARGIAGIYCDHIHMEHYFDYLYTHREFLDAIMVCGFDSLFLEMINDYVLKKWLFLSDKYTLIAFSGALFNSFIHWSSRAYSDDKELLINNLVEIFTPRLNS